MITSLPPCVFLLIGALFVPLIKGKNKSIYLMLLPLLAFYNITQLEVGTFYHVHFFGYDLTLLRVDKLSKIFGYVFTLNAFAAFWYAFYLKDNQQHVAALLYVGSALGVVFAGDMVSLYFFWEGMAVASTFLILARRTSQAYGAGYRYILVHLFGGLVLLAGIVLYINQHGSPDFNAITDRSLASYLILIGILVNAAVPPFSAWLSDAYPAATVTGGVFLSAYTTKTAVYTLIRGFPGWEILLVLGCIMVLYGIVFALLSNDIRQMLAYSIINQVGFMVVAVGIGSAMALNGAAAHAFAHIIYKSLLWMSAGAVLYATGKTKATDLGGQFSSMPWVVILGAIGALTMAGFPLTSSFTCKSIILEAAVHEHFTWPWMIMEIAAAGDLAVVGVFLLAMSKTAPQSGPVKLGPSVHKSMYWAMGLLAFLCIYIGVNPQPIYDLLPYEMHFHSVYTSSHVMHQLQLVLFATLAFVVFIRPLQRTKTIVLDTDFIYRRGGEIFYLMMKVFWNGLNSMADKVIVKDMTSAINRFFVAAPQNIVMFFVNKEFMGIGSSKADKNKIIGYFQTGFAPVGLGVVAATVYLFAIILYTL